MFTSYSAVLDNVVQMQNDVTYVKSSTTLARARFLRVPSLPLNALRTFISTRTRLAKLICTESHSSPRTPAQRNEAQHLNSQTSQHKRSKHSYVMQFETELFTLMQFAVLSSELKKKKRKRRASRGFLTNTRVAKMRLVPSDRCS